MAISLAVAATAGWRWFAASRDNTTIRKLVAGENVEVDPSRASSKVLGRARLLSPEARAYRRGAGGAPAAKLIPLPNEANAQQLSMLTVNPPTAALMLSEFVKLEPGEWVLQNVANSGVGSYLIQLANIRGYKTVNIVRRQAAAQGVQAMGGNVVLVDGPGLAKRVKEATAGANIRLGIDAVGGAATDRIASCLANGATLVNYGMMSGEPCQVSPRNFVFNDITLRGFWLAKWFRSATREQQMALYGELTKLIATGKLHARVHATYDVSDIKAAVAAANAGERDGKILIVPTPR